MSKSVSLGEGLSLVPAENLKIVGKDIILGIEASANRLRLSWIRYFREHRREYYLPGDRIDIDLSRLLEDEDYNNLLMLVLSYQQGALLGGRIPRLKREITTIGKKRVIAMLHGVLAKVSEEICKSKELVEAT